MSELNSKTDLTRWNRAGLERFRYIDGNAVTYLETLRLLMKEAFTEGATNKWQDLDTAIPVPLNESSAQRSARWLQQYKDDRRDYAWEILRTYARSTHILMEYLDAYANENFLRTATEWENVRRLVEMIDYHPSPPASAETVIVLEVKKDLAGTVDAGFAVKNKPTDGSKPVTFEALADLEVDASLNEIKTRNWDKSQNHFIYNHASNTAIFNLVDELEDISIGTLGVLVVQPTSGPPVGVTITVSAISKTQLTLAGKSASSVLPSTIYDHQVTLLLKPETKREPELHGPKVISLGSDHGLSVGAVIAWKPSSSWVLAKVLEVSGKRVRLSSNPPAVGKQIYATEYALRAQHEINSVSQTGFVLPAHLDGLRYYGAIWNENFDTISDNHNHFEVDFIENYSDDKLFYIPKRDPIATTLESGIQTLTFAGKAKKISTGDWIIAAAINREDPFPASQVAEIHENTDNFELVPSTSLSNVKELHSQFALMLQPKDADKNFKPVYLTAEAYRSSQYSVIPLENPIPELLLKNRSLIIAGKESAMNVTVKAVDSATGYLTVSPAIPGSEPGGSSYSDNYSRYDTSIYANVVAVGHGETQNKKNLGSGDATQSNQSFHLDVDDISFVSDASFSTGVKADLEISVANRSYTQVASLNDSEAEDPHYTVRMREDATLDIIFGDGKYGRRLPSGSNNISVVYRTGTGLEGNIPASSLVKAVKPHYLIESVSQPILAAGGNDMESAESMREHAPASVLTLERAVSLTDFANLAETNSSVWQAAARMEKPGMARSEKINVAVVPAGGGDLGGLASTLQQTLANHSLPGVLVNIIRYQAVLLNLNIIVNVKIDEFDIDEVELAVKQQLLSDFSLQNTRLGKSFYRSQVLQSVESVTGVENCQCEIPNGFIDENNLAVQAQSTALSTSGQVKRITPSWQQLVYLHSELSLINLTMQAFSP